MINGINASISSAYQRQLINSVSITPPVSISESGLKDQNSDYQNSDYKIDIRNEKSNLEKEYNDKKNTLKQEHEAEIKQLDNQYNKEQSQIKREYSTKKRALNLSIYA